MLFGMGIAVFLTCAGGTIAYIMIAERHRKQMEQEGGLEAGALKEPEYVESTKSMEEVMKDHGFMGGRGSAGMGKKPLTRKEKEEMDRWLD